MNNNPVRYNDPSGHAAWEGGGVSAMPKTFWQYLKEYREFRETEVSFFPTNSVKQRQIPLVQPARCPAVKTTIEPYYPRLYGVPLGIPTQGPPTKLEEITAYAQWGNNAAGVGEDLIKAGIILKKGFTWGRAVNPFPVLDIVLGATGQVVSDADNPDLTLLLRIERASVVGVESGVTGVVSDVAGAGGFALGGLIAPGPGAVVGCVGAGLGTSIAMDEVVWKEFNRRNFEGWGLGSYP